MDSRLFLYRILIELSRSEAIYRRRRSSQIAGLSITYYIFFSFLLLGQFPVAVASPYGVVG